MCGQHRSTHWRSAGTTACISGEVEVAPFASGENVRNTARISDYVRAATFPSVTMRGRHLLHQRRCAESTFRISGELHEATFASLTMCEQHHSHQWRSAGSTVRISGDVWAASFDSVAIYE
uniref:Pyridoxamine 5'-phosphate oxidase family protein n=1 Tax=Angiostrongylus cantonensis TaxID=6313 RepID=A0A0K0CSQ6_ANGCA